MKKSYLLSILLLLKCFQSSSQTWNRFAPAPTTLNISKIVSPDPVHLKGMGDHLFLRSDDGGISWQTQQINHNLFDICFPDSLNGWISSDSLHIFHTTNGGISWQTQNMPGRKPIFIDSNNGFCLGDSSFYATVDGGNTWTMRFTGLNNSCLSALEFTDPMHGWIAHCNSHSILKTTDGGYTWSIFPLPLSPQYQFAYGNGISFSDTLHGWISMQSDSLLKTTDGGLTWQFITCPVRDASIDFKDSLLGIATYSNQIYTTSDGGTSWTNTLTIGGYINLKTFSASPGFLAGSAYDGNILRSSDGYTWDHFINGCNFNIDPQPEFYEPTQARLDFSNGRRGFLCGGLIYEMSSEEYRGSSYCTVDSGLSWKLLNDKVTQMQFLSDSNIYFSSINTLTQGWVLWHTTDYFQTQTYVFSNPGGAICFTDSLHGVCYNWYTLDGGLTWQISNITGNNGSFNQINFINALEGWAIDSVNIYKTIDGGVNWTQTYHAPLNIFRKIQFVNSMDGFLLRTDRDSPNRKLMKTSDGGLNWDTIPLPFTITDFYFRDNLNGWFTVSDFDPLNHGIYHTYDGGLTTVLEDTNNVDVIDFLSDDRGFAIGEKIILKTDQSGIFNNIQTTESEIDFTVYPIPSSGQINIKCQKEIKYIELFDMQGKVQYTKSFKNKDISFSKDNLTSGEYLLRAHFADQSVRSKAISIMQ